jgi:hypothetical protein
MGWDNERYPRTKKDTLQLSFIGFGISHSRFSEFGISFLDLGYPIPGFLNLGYPRDIPKTSKDAPGISSTWSYPWPIPEISHRYPKTSRLILGVGVPPPTLPVVAPAPALAAAPLGPPAGFRLAAPSEVLAGSALVGQAVLYRWPMEGSVRSTVTGRSRADGFSHVVRYGRTSALGAGMVLSLLDAASHGPAGRWVLLRRRAVP